MRLDKAQDLLKRHSCEFSYTEEDGLGSIDLIYRGVSYYIWEFADGEEKGVETNLRSGGRSEDIPGGGEWRCPLPWGGCRSPCCPDSRSIGTS